MCQTNDSMLNCSIPLQPDCLHIVWSRIEPECSKLCETWYSNGRIEIGNIVGDLLVIPITSESAGQPLKSGYLVDLKKWQVSVSGERSTICIDEYPQSGTRHMNTGKSEARTRHKDTPMSPSKVQSHTQGHHLEHHVTRPDRDGHITLHPLYSDLPPILCAVHPCSCSLFSSSPQIGFLFLVSG